MLEAMLGTVQSPSENPIDQFFITDGFTTPPQPTLIRGNGVEFESTPTVDGVTLGGALGEVATYIRLAAPLDLTAGEWTFEYSCIIDGPANEYIGELVIGQTQFSTGLGSRWGNPGFGNRFQFATGNGLEDVNSTQIVKADRALLRRVALVKVGTLITVYVDGTKRMLANSVGTSYTVNGLPIPAELSSTQFFVFGVRANFGPCRMRMGPMRLSNFARYTADYTPVPF